MSQERETAMPQDAQFALDFNPDVSVERIAAVYAEAIASAADTKAVSLTELVAELDSLVVDVLDVEKAFDGVLASAMVSVDDKETLLARVLEGRVSPLLLQFLRVIARHGRLDILRDIARQVAAVDRVRRGEVRVTVTSAAALDDAARAEIAARLDTLIDGKPVLTCHVDPALIGGLVVRVGDMVYDASLLTQLKTVRQQMIDRSTHEIQSRRDSFRHSEGN